MKILTNEKLQNEFSEKMKKRVEDFKKENILRGFYELVESVKE